MNLDEPTLLEFLLACLEPQRVSQLIPKIYDAYAENSIQITPEELNELFNTVIQKNSPVYTILKGRSSHYVIH